MQSWHLLSDSINVVYLHVCGETADKIRRRPLNTYAFLAKHEVKMAEAEYCPCSFFAFLWTKTRSRSIKTQKERDQYQNIQPSPLNKLQVNKGFFHMVKRLHRKNSLLREQSGNAVPSGQDSAILPAWVTNKNTGFAFSSPFVEPAI